MRLSASWIVPVTLVVVAVACNTFDPDSCFPNTSGGYGGSETIPIGAAVGASSGDFATPGEGPLDDVGNANPCIEPQSPCNQRCESTYTVLSIECGKIADADQRRACQDNAYVAYKSCRDFCQQTNGGDCLEHCNEKCDQVMEKCFRDCPKGDKICMGKCNNEYSKCLKECSDRCK